MITSREIEKFCDKHGITLSTFGREAVNDPSFIRRVRPGRTVKQATEDKVRAYMARVEAERETTRLPE